MASVSEIFRELCDEIGIQNCLENISKTKYVSRIFIIIAKMVKLKTLQQGGYVTKMVYIKVRR
jgi:hypothetical protein